MDYSVNTTIKGPSRGSASAFYGYAVSKGSSRLPDVKLYLDTLEKLCRSNGIRFELVVAQSIHETSESGVPWASYWWKQRVNPAGIGITGDAAQDNASRVFTDGSAAARAHFLHLYLYAVGTTIPTGLSKNDDPRYAAAVDEGYAGIAKTISDLTNRWGIDNQYAQGVVKWLTLFESIGQLGDVPDEPEKEPDVVEYKTTVVGLPGGKLTTDYPINTSNLLGYSEKQNPMVKASTPRRSVQHGTGNPNSMASSENRWLVQGAGDGQWVSFHFVVDDLGVYQNLDVSMISYQAADGAGPGNMNGYSCEMIENSTLWANPDRIRKVIHNAGDLMGRIAARLNVAKPEQHWDFNYMLPASQRHDCPNMLRYRYLDGVRCWDLYVKEWNAAKASELKRMAGEQGSDTGTTVPPAATYAKPVPIKELEGVTVEAGDSAPGIVTREADQFIFVGDVVEATQATPRLQYANITSSPKVGPDIDKGERFIVLWLIQAADDAWYYITPYWTRVAQKHTKRIADALTAPIETEHSEVE